MPKNLIALILIVAGVLLIRSGQQRVDSIKGVSETLATKVATAWDGKERLPEHLWYSIGGGVLIVAGLGLALKRK